MHVSDLADFLLAERGIIINTKDYKTSTSQLYCNDSHCVMSVNSWIRQGTGLFGEYLFKSKLYVVTAETRSLKLIDERHSIHRFKWPFSPIKFEDVRFEKNYVGAPVVIYNVSTEKETPGMMAEIVFGESEEPQIRPIK